MGLWAYGLVGRSWLIVGRARGLRLWASLAWACGREGARVGRVEGRWPAEVILKVFGLRLRRTGVAENFWWSVGRNWVRVGGWSRGCGCW